jgi:hypothetical protein
MVSYPNTITAVTNLNIKFVVTLYGFQLYFITVETETADFITESYM